MRGRVRFLVQILPGLVNCAGPAHLACEALRAEQVTAGHTVDYARFDSPGLGGGDVTKFAPRKTLKFL